VASPDAVDLAVLSNRGPVSFRWDDSGRLVARRGAGGLIATLGPGVERTGALWMAAAITDADRDAASAEAFDADGFALRWLLVEPDLYRAAYGVIANKTLWFLHHGLWDLPRLPRFDRYWWQAWDAYREFNQRFASAAAKEVAEGGTVLIQDYHLSLVPAALAAMRPDLHLATFHHTPFCNPSELRVLPDLAASELIEGMAGARACGFHSARWARRFEACAAEVLGRVPPTFVAPAAPDLAGVREVAGGEECAEEIERLDARIGGGQLIARVDRIELSKNLLRGFLAYDHLLAEEPRRRGRVTFAAYVYPSRDDLPEYLAYRQEMETLVRRINDRWASGDWTPILLDTGDNYPQSVAGLCRYDVLLVNPIRDGLNLVAKEGAAVNRRSGVLALSPGAGAWDELGPYALKVHPFDITGTAAVLARALDLPADDRASRAAQLRAAAEARTPHDWFADLVRAARG
jgi:trehalose 6-phosphate synthase